MNKNIIDSSAPTYNADSIIVRVKNAWQPGVVGYATVDELDRIRVYDDVLGYWRTIHHLTAAQVRAVRARCGK